MQKKISTPWLCRHAGQLEKFSGQWVAVDPTAGLVGKAGSMLKILKMAQQCDPALQPYILHVPSKQKLRDLCPKRPKK